MRAQEKGTGSFFCGTWANREKPLIVAAVAVFLCSFFPPLLRFLISFYSEHITLFVAECVNGRFLSAPYKINNFISLADRSP